MSPRVRSWVGRVALVAVVVLITVAGVALVLILPHYEGVSEALVALSTVALATWTFALFHSTHRTFELQETLQRRQAIP